MHFGYFFAIWGLTIFFGGVLGTHSALFAGAGNFFYFGAPFGMAVGLFLGPWVGLFLSRKPMVRSLAAAYIPTFIVGCAVAIAKDPFRAILPSAGVLFGISLVLHYLMNDVPMAFPVGFCRACGYDLTGNVSGICPECGNSTTGDTV